MFLNIYFGDFQNIGTSEHADSKYVIRFVLLCQEDCLKNRQSSTEEALSQENCTLIFLGDFLLLLFLWHFLPFKNCKGDFFQES